MSKLLEKALRDEIKEKNCTFGTKEVMNSIKDSKLIVLSHSIKDQVYEKIESDAKKIKVPTIKFDGSSVALGKLCGNQFRVSTVSFNSLSDTNVKSILKESENK